MVAEGRQRSVEEIYQKKTQLEHILLRPDSYVGSVEAAEYRQIWLLNAAQDQMERRTITVVPALYKIFDEILVNAADNKQRDPKNMNTIKVEIDREVGEISVYNNGKAVPVQIHSEHNIYVPELIFGHLLTSSNYDDGQKKTTGGRNGFGAKLTNIYSTKFIVETNDCQSGQYYKQVFEKNMSVKNKPQVKKATHADDWTRITFRPDFPKFGMNGFDDDSYNLMVKRVYDLAGITDKTVRVYLNGAKLPVRTFKEYVAMYLPEGADTQRVYDESCDRWQICVAPSDGVFEQVSFVNSIWTIKGGKHVDYITDQVTKGALAAILKRKGAPKNLKPSHIRNHMFVFVNALVENPAFDSQTKETLTSNSRTFGSKCDVSELFIKKVLDIGIRDAVLSWSKFRETKDLKKNDGVKKSKILGIPKLDDANFAGTRQSASCTLILTEGDSAKALAVSGLSIIGRDKYGVFPLKGKLLNVREATGAQILKNEEICNIKKILGLQQGTVYHDVSRLRYGHLMIMTDQDHDGSHIKGLLINFLHTFWPSLLKMNNFLSQFITPIVKVTKGRESISFYTVPEYETWRQAHPSGWKIKYFKGLGTSTSKDAKEYFSAINQHRIAFRWDDQMNGKLNDDSIEKAFSKKRADDRKQWLAAMEEGTYIDYRLGPVSYTDFVDRELVLFSQSDNFRSIPSMLDGLKPGQRKILYGCFKRKLTGEIKVAQLAGYVAEHSAYHHGEVSLTGTIINLAQNYCGSNNINLLLPNGQFGTRHALGKDSASARYIFTALSPVTRTLFPEEDDPLLEYLDDDGMKIEPKHYVPIIPMVLVNGAEGIGTGWSTSVPQFNPRHIVEWIRRRLQKSCSRPVLVPWYKSYLGSIKSVPGGINGAAKYELRGIVQRDRSSFSILEVPIGRSTDSYKAMLEERDEKRDILGFQARHTDIRIDFQVEVGTANECPMASATEDELMKMLKLSSSITCSNMVLFDSNQQIKHYPNVEAILEDHFIVRNALYILRKDHLMSVLDRQCRRLENKAKFIKGCISDTIAIRNVPRAIIESALDSLGFDRLPAQSHDTIMIILKNRRPDDDSDSSSTSYDYLLNMPLLSLTKEKVVELLASLDEKRREIDRLSGTTPQDMWLDDLDRFLKVLEEHEAAESAEQAAADATLAKKTKRISPHLNLIAAANARQLNYANLSLSSCAPAPFDDDDAVEENNHVIETIATSKSSKTGHVKPIVNQPSTNVSSKRFGDDHYMVDDDDSSEDDDDVNLRSKAKTTKLRGDREDDEGSQSKPNVKRPSMKEMKMANAREDRPSLKVEGDDILADAFGVKAKRTKPRDDQKDDQAPKSKPIVKKLSKKEMKIVNDREDDEEPRSKPIVKNPSKKEMKVMTARDDRPSLKVDDQDILAEVFDDLGVVSPKQSTVTNQIRVDSSDDEAIIVKEPQQVPNKMLSLSERLALRKLQKRSVTPSDPPTPLAPGKRSKLSSSSIL